MQLNLQFKDERFNHLLKIIREITNATTYKGKVYLTGECLQCALVNETSKFFELAVDEVEGGPNFALLIAIKTKCYKSGMNPFMDTNYGTGMLRITTDDKVRSIFIVVKSFKRILYSTSPKVLRGTMNDDAKLRSFTVNALYYNVSTNELFDPTNRGLSDIESKILRNVDDPDKYFREDPVACISAIRQASNTGFSISKDTWLSIINCAPLLSKADADDISMEFESIILSKKPSVALRRLQHCGALRYILMDVSDLEGVSNKHTSNLFEFTIQCMDLVKASITTRMALLLHGIGYIIKGKSSTDQIKLSADFAEAECVDLGVDKDIARDVSKIIRHIGDFSAYSASSQIPKRKVRKFMSSLGNLTSDAIDIINVINLKSKEKKQTQCLEILDIMAEIQEDDAKKELKIPINGRDIMTTFGIKGSKIAKCLDAVKEQFSVNPDMTKDECLHYVKIFIASTMANKTTVTKN